MHVAEAPGCLIEIFQVRTSLCEGAEVTGVVMLDTTRFTCVKTEDEPWTSRLVSLVLNLRED
jgi:hypothetical protein